jgi:hypothetical protein
MPRGEVTGRPPQDFRQHSRRARDGESRCNGWVAIVRENPSPLKSKRGDSGAGLGRSIKAHKSLACRPSSVEAVSRVFGPSSPCSSSGATSGHGPETCFVSTSSRSLPPTWHPDRPDGQRERLPELRVCPCLRPCSSRAPADPALHPTDERQGRALYPVDAPRVRLCLLVLGRTKESFEAGCGTTRSAKPTPRWALPR